MPLVSKSEEAAEALPAGIIIHVYGDIATPADDLRVLFPHQGEGYIAEDVCVRIAQNFNIGALTFHLFALARPDLSAWLPPNHRIQTSPNETLEYVFRVRYKPHEDNFPSIIANKSGNREAFEYYFLQQRDDFVSDRLKGHVKDMGQSGMLGLAVIDCLRYGKEKNMDLSQLKKMEAEKFIPPSSAQSFKLPWSKLRLSSSFGPKMEKEWRDSEQDSVIDTKWRYMKGLWKYIVGYGMETFDTNDGTVIHVDPHHLQYPGIYCTTSQNSGHVRHNT